MTRGILKCGLFTSATLALTLLNATAQEAVSSQQATTIEGVEVSGTAITDESGGLPRQEAPVGPYGQPEWTTQRAFSTTRVYVRPPGQVAFVQFWTPDFNYGKVSHTFREEIEIGLPCRFQLDLYQNWDIDEGGRASYGGSSVELRHAFADWGKIPLNPTIYLEWTFNDSAPDVAEVKLLFAEVLAKHWHWAANFTYEQETGGERETALQFSQALSYALLDQKLNAGVEMFYENATVKGSRGDAENVFLIGPSIGVRPTRDTYINVAPLFGVTIDAPDAQIYVTAGFKFGGARGASEGEVRAPSSMFGR